MNRAEFHVADSCIGCGKCVLVCPGGVLSLGEDHKPRIKDFSEFGWIGHGCWRCEHCLAVCPQGAVSYTHLLCVEIPEEKVGEIRTNQRIAMMSEDIEVSKLPVQAVSGQQPQSMGSPVGSRGGEGVCLAIIDTGVAPHYDLIRPFNRIDVYKRQPRCLISSSNTSGREIQENWKMSSIEW